MAVVNVRLYELLKPKLGKEAARMLVEAVPGADQLATKADLAGLKAELTSELKVEVSELKADIAKLNTELRETKADLMRWMLTFFVPLWLGVWGVLAALVLKA